MDAYTSMITLEQVLDTILDIMERHLARDNGGKLGKNTLTRLLSFRALDERLPFPSPRDFTGVQVNLTWQS